MPPPPSPSLKLNQHNHHHHLNPTTTTTSTPPHQHHRHHHQNTKTISTPQFSLWCTSLVWSISIVWENGRSEVQHTRRRWLWDWDGVQGERRLPWVSGEAKDAANFGQSLSWAFPPAGQYEGACLQSQAERSLLPDQLRNHWRHRSRGYQPVPVYGSDNNKGRPALRKT